jgi:threonine aldolase
MKHLSVARVPPNPQSFFLDLAAQCETLHVDKQDMYNDYDQAVDTSKLRAFEAEVAAFIGKEEGIFGPSGCMAQNMVLAMGKEKSLSPHFVCHWSSHLLIHEFDSWKHLLHMNALVLPPKQDQAIQDPFTYEGFMKIVHDNPDKKISVVIVECPHREIGGKITSWEDLVKISTYCREHNIHLHMDGARLWEAQAAYEGHSLHELSALFDTIYVSFYKGIGGITGAMLLGKSFFIADSRPWLRRFGGNLFSHMPYYVSCLSCFRQNKDSFQERKVKFVEVVQHLQQQLLSTAANSVEGKTAIFFDPPLPLVSLVHVYMLGDLATVTEANNRAAQRCQVQCFSRFRAGRFGAQDYCYSEVNMVSTSSIAPFHPTHSYLF